MEDFYSDPDEYDFFIKDRDDLKFYNDRCIDRVLELGCGTGRLTIPLARRSDISITGVDNSKSMLEKAMSKVDADRVDWILDDIKSVQLFETYDYVIAPFNVLQHMYKPQDVEDVFDTVKSHLAPKGTFIFDIQMPNIERLVEMSGVTEEIVRFNEHLTMNQTCHYNPLTQTNTVVWEYLKKKKLIKLSSFKLKMFFPIEIQAHLHYNNFNIIEAYGSFDGKDLGEGDKQIYICEAK